MNPVEISDNIRALEIMIPKDSPKFPVPQPTGDFTVCPSCGGLKGDFAGTPCSCITSDSGPIIQGGNPDNTLVQQIRLPAKTIRNEPDFHQSELIKENEKLKADADIYRQQFNRAQMKVAELLMAINSIMAINNHQDYTYDQKEDMIERYAKDAILKATQ